MGMDIVFIQQPSTLSLLGTACVWRCSCRQTAAAILLACYEAELPSWDGRCGAPSILPQGVNCTCMAIDGKQAPEGWAGSTPVFDVLQERKGDASAQLLYAMTL